LDQFGFVIIEYAKSFG